MSSKNQNPLSTFDGNHYTCPHIAQNEKDDCYCHVCMDEVKNPILDLKKRKIVIKNKFMEEKKRINEDIEKEDSFYFEEFYYMNSARHSKDSDCNTIIEMLGKIEEGKLGFTFVTKEGNKGLLCNNSMNSLKKSKVMLQKKENNSKFSPNKKVDKLSKIKDCLLKFSAL